MFDCIICKINTSTVSNYRKHLISRTHIRNLEALNVTKSSIPFPLNSKPTPSGCEFRENAVASDWTNNPVLTVY